MEQHILPVVVGQRHRVPCEVKDNQLLEWFQEKNTPNVFNEITWIKNSWEILSERLPDRYSSDIVSTAGK